MNEISIIKHVNEHSYIYCIKFLQYFDLTSSGLYQEQMNVTDEDVALTRQRIIREKTLQ